MSELLFRLEDRWGSILGTCIGVSVVIAFHYLIVWLRKEKKPGKKSILEKKKLWLIIYVLALVLGGCAGLFGGFLGDDSAGVLAVSILCLAVEGIYLLYRLLYFYRGTEGAVKWSLIAMVGYVFWLIDFAFKDDMNPIGHSLIGMLGSHGGILIFVGIVHDFCLITGKRQG